MRAARHEEADTGKSHQASDDRDQILIGKDDYSCEDDGGNQCGQACWQCPQADPADGFNKDDLTTVPLGNFLQIRMLIVVSQIVEHPKVTIKKVDVK